ncbi:MAG: hypothetical protein ACYC1C_21095, partial [Chloroflexota bacterium]
MKITGLQTHVLSIKLPRPTGVPVAGRLLDEVNPVLVRLRTDTGPEGFGFCFVPNRHNVATLHAAVQDVAQMVMGEDPLRT